MTNVEHKEHSFYISRYPAGREATVFDNVIDLKFRNDNPTAIMIQTVWTPELDHGADLRDEAVRRHVGHRARAPTRPSPRP